MLRRMSSQKSSKAFSPTQLMDELRDRYRASPTQTLALLFNMSRSLYRYQSVRQEATTLLMQIREIANTRLHYGYRRARVMLKREGWQDNVKRVHRLYQEQGLSLRMKRPKRNKSARSRQLNLYIAPLFWISFGVCKNKNAPKRRIFTCNLAEAVKFAYILQAAVWLASQTLRTPHEMCAGTLIASKAKVPVRGL